MGKDFNNMSQTQIEEYLLAATETNDLYWLDIWLDKKVSSMFMEISDLPEGRPKLEKKSELSWATNLIDICKKKELETKEGSDAFNRRFRIEAQKKLSPGVYNSIAEAAKR